MMNALLVRLKKPSSVVLMNSGQSGELVREDIPPMTLLVSDAANQRLVGMPLVDHKKYHVRFWLFLEGPNAEQTAVTLMKNHAIEWAFGASIGWEYTFKPVDLSSISALATPAPSATSSNVLDRATCNPERLENAADTARASAEAAQAAAFGQQMCSSSSICGDGSYQLAGFPSSACCTDFCQSSFTSCGLKIALWGAGLTSLQKCTGLQALEQCLSEQAKVAYSSASCLLFNPATVNILPYMDAILSVPATSTKKMKDGPCKNTTATLGCSGMCDKKIQDLLQVNQTWLGSSNPNASVVGMLYDLTTFDIEAFRFFGKVINEMKTQEQVVSGQKGVYPTSSANFSAWGPGTRLYNFLQLYSYNLRQSSPPITLANAKLSFSSTVDWTLPSDLASFMSQELVPVGTAYWMAGGTLGKQSGFTTQFNYPTGLATDKAQRVYVSDSVNARIMRIENIWHSDNFSTVPAGTGYSTFNGNGDLADETSLAYPRGLTVDDYGVLHFADTKAHDIRQVLGLTWSLPCTLSSTLYQPLLDAPSGADCDRIGHTTCIIGFLGEAGIHSRETGDRTAKSKP